MALTRTHDAATIVCLGSFNPPIFSPAWLLARGLIQKTEEGAAEVQAITPDVAAFKTKWLQLQVLRDRFSAATESFDDSLLLRDLVVGAFKFLEHTPVQSVGLNRQIHVQLASAEEWHQIGHAFAPKSIWRKYLSQPGLAALVIKDVIEGGKPAEINVQVNPSFTKTNTVEVSVNHHFALPKGAAAAAAADLIAEQWEKCTVAASEITEGAITDALKEKANG